MEISRNQESYAELQQRLRQALDMNRNMRRTLFHVIRLYHGGSVRVRMHDLVKYTEALEEIRWRTCEETRDCIIMAVYHDSPPTPFSLGTESKPVGIRAAYRALTCEVRKAMGEKLREVRRTISNTARTVKDIVTKPSPPPAPDKNPKK